jgi:hypothetical protein
VSRKRKSNGLYRVWIIRADLRGTNVLPTRLVADVIRDATMQAHPRDNLLVWEVFPFALSLAVLGGAALAIDAALHFANMVWIGKWLGIPGVLLIIGSFGYSLRKRQLISSGKPVALLRLHERMAWAGSLLILVHAGIHFNAWLAWLATWAMLINVTSGLTGKYLLQRVRKRFAATQTRLRQAGVSESDIDERTHFNSLTVDVVRKWRVLHVSMSFSFAVLALAHIGVELWFWGFRS